MLKFDFISSARLTMVVQLYTSFHFPPHLEYFLMAHIADCSGAFVIVSSKSCLTIS